MDSSKTGPKPKKLKEKVVFGLEVGRGDNKEIVPPDQVYELAAIGCTDTEIAQFFQIKQDTLRYNFASELAKGREFVKIRLRRAMFQNACDHMNPAVQIFLAKNILGMTSEPADAQANHPLPWREDVEDDIEIEEETNEIHQEDD